jgi:hypothetical protein
MNTPDPSTETRLVAITTDPHQPVLGRDCWHPWINCRDSLDMFSRLVLHRFLRERGGVHPESAPLEVRVHVATPAARRDKNGHPIECLLTVYTVSPK